MIWEIKSFSELDTDTLYAILQLRVAVFVVEQNCPYQEADGADRDALHLYARNEHGDICAYARLFLASAQQPQQRIGRVICAPQARGSGLGRELMRRAIDCLAAQQAGQAIIIGAQVYLHDFYRSLGFVDVSAEYLEDGIPHIDMQLPADGAA